MRPVTMYTKPWCGFCARAKALLDHKDVPYDEIDVSGDLDLERTMIDRARGAYTVPQIFVGDDHVGGSDELHALEARGELDALLAGPDA
jgi:glutaredoxin 3